MSNGGIDMNTSFEKTSGSDEWYTPPEIVTSLGHFDLDPCSPIGGVFRLADVLYTKEDNGLTKEWKGRVWLNPPYSKPLYFQFADKMAKHGSGIMLTFDRMDNRFMQDHVLPHADSVFFMRGRIKFYDISGEQRQGAGCGSILVSYSQYDTEAIANSGLKGVLMRILKK